MQALHSSQNLAKSLLNDYAPFDPLAYLHEYYTELGEENRALLDFFDKAYAHIFNEIRSARVLEFGGGPTVYQLISAAKYPVAIDFSEYLDRNLHELSKWLEDRAGKFAWDAFIAYTLGREGESSTPASVRRRAQLIRDKVQQLMYCDARMSQPLGALHRSGYDIVSANFVLEAITGDMLEWSQMIDRVTQLIRPGGYFLICTVTGAESYRVGDLYYPTTSLTPEIMIAKLKQKNFSIALTHSVDAEHQEQQGYEGIFMVLARS